MFGVTKYNLTHRKVKCLYPTLKPFMDLPYNGNISIKLFVILVTLVDKIVNGDNRHKGIVRKRKKLILELDRKKLASNRREVEISEMNSLTISYSHYTVNLYEISMEESWKLVVHDEGSNKN